MRPGTETLAALPLLASFSAPQIAALNNRADLARLGPDEVLFREGDRPAELNILLAGYVAEIHGKNGENAMTDVIGPVTPIGFASAMLGAPSPTGARTITSARLIVIPTPELRAMIRTKPALALPFLDHALAGMREQTLELCAMKLRSSVQRLAAFLLGLVEDPDMSPARFVLPVREAVPRRQDRLHAGKSVPSVWCASESWRGDPAGRRRGARRCRAAGLRRTLAARRQRCLMSDRGAASPRRARPPHGSAGTSTRCGTATMRAHNALVSSTRRAQSERYQAIRCAT